MSIIILHRVILNHSRDGFTVSTHIGNWPIVVRKCIGIDGLRKHRWQRWQLELSTPSSGSSVSFSSVEELEEFIGKELDFWGWLNDPSVQGQIPGDPYRVINEQWRVVLNQLPTYRGKARESASTIQTLVNDHVFAAKVPLSSSTLARALNRMRIRDPLAAGIALSNYMDRYTPNNNYKHLGAIIELLFADLGITPDGIETRSDEFADLLRSQAVALDRQKSVQTDQQTSLERFRSRTKKLERVVLRKIERRANSFRAEKNAQVDVAMNSLAQTEAAYREQMRLKAPVEYWSAKAKRHVKQAKLYRCFLTVFAIVGSVVLLAVLWALGNHAVDLARNEKPGTMYLIFATLGIVATTIVFWIARVLDRLFFSEYHLAIDSEERSVMTETYLALIADGKISEAERNLVLASLFRPTADGIVKDDAAPDISPGALISKILSR